MMVQKHKKSANGGKNMYNKLFSPLKIRGMELKNRAIFPAMGTRMAENRAVTDRLIQYHVARVKGGCGLNIVEVSSVHTPSAPRNFLGICEDDLIPSHKKLTDAVHQAGGKAGIQLWQGSLAVGMDPAARIFMVNDTTIRGYTLPAITLAEIDEIVDCYGQAARRCVEAGYDCIEFHCAHNYLPHSFLSGGLNHRTDEYGGSFENRAKFPLRCIRAIRANIPEDMPLLMRIDAQDDQLPGGMTLDDTVAFCKLAQAEGVDVLDVSRGNIVTAATVYEVPPIDIPRGFNVDNAAYIREKTGMLTVAVGRINTPELAESILEEGKADMVVMGRAQLADPEFLNKAQAGRTEDIVYCVACNQGCYDGFCDLQNRPFITCLRNPQLGREGEWTLTKAETPKTVWIAGGGMAGLEAAKVLQQRGHKPVVFEAADHLGGQFLTAGRAPGKQEMADAAELFGRQVEKMGVEIRLNTPLTPQLLQEGKPDAVILAVGACPIRMPVESTDTVRVAVANEVLDGLETIEGETVVIGGGLVGLEVADFLATRGNKVHVVEMAEKAGKDLGSLRAITVMSKMRALNVEILTDTRFEKLCETGVICAGKEGEVTIPCRNVVVAVGSRPKDCTPLEQTCAELGIPCTKVGDAKQARRALDAVAEGFEAARTL